MNSDHTRPDEVRHMSGKYPNSISGDIDIACCAAADSFAAYSQLPLDERAQFLEMIAEELELKADVFLDVTPRETGLSESRIVGELARTAGQLRLFAGVVRDGDFLGARIDRGDKDRRPFRKPDLRQYWIPLGPVAVFGASNFPLAFSVAGGDTASALAAGCPVVVKAHPAHPMTSSIAAAAIAKAIERSTVPSGVFSMIYGHGIEIGTSLVRHAEIKAVGFTGSFSGGVALERVAAERPVPIPVYAEMGSANPIFLLPEAMRTRASNIAADFVASFTLGCGQFCTKPGVVFAVGGDDLEIFLNEATKRIEVIDAGTMLHDGILANFEQNIERVRNLPGVNLVAEGRPEYKRGQAQLYKTTVATLHRHPELLDEIFGPISLVVEAANVPEIIEIVNYLPGQLTAGVHGSDEEMKNSRHLIQRLTGRAGRVLFNGFPTGVEVSHAMVHGGPYPATTNSRMTSVGTLAIDRFMRPICFQDFPADVLPPALRDDNPLNIKRLIDGNWEN